MFRLTTSVPAVQYKAGSSVAPVAELIRSVRPGFSHSNAMGYLEFRNGATVFTVPEGHWVAMIAGSITVISDEAFRQHFTEA